MNIYGRQCNWDKEDGAEFCHVHADAREEGWNWWEWEDEEAAEAFRLEMVERVEAERAQERESDGRTYTVELKLAAPQKRPWWRRLFGG